MPISSISVPTPHPFLQPLFLFFFAENSRLGPWDRKWLRASISGWKSGESEGKDRAGDSFWTLSLHKSVGERQRENMKKRGRGGICPLRSSSGGVRCNSIAPFPPLPLRHHQRWSSCAFSYLFVMWPLAAVNKPIEPNTHQLFALMLCWDLSI